MRHVGLCAALVLAVCAVGARADDYTWNANNGDWSVGTNWTPTTGAPPGSGDIGTIDATGQRARAYGDLPEAPDEVLVQAGGILELRTSTLSDHNLVMDGGILKSYWDHSAAYSHTVAVKSDSNIGAGVNGTWLYLTLSGPIVDYDGSNTGLLKVEAIKGGDNSTSHSVHISGAGNTWSGGTLVTGAYLQVSEDGGLGTGTATITGGTLGLDGVTAATGGAPLLVNGGRLRIGGVTASHTVHVDGGDIRVWRDKSTESHDTFLLNGDSTFEIQCGGAGKVFDFRGTMTDGDASGRLVLHKDSGGSYSHQFNVHTVNDYTGGTLVGGGCAIYPKVAGALGSGTIEVASGGALVAEVTGCIGSNTLVVDGKLALGAANTTARAIGINPGGTLEYLEAGAGGHEIHVDGATVRNAWDKGPTCTDTVYLKGECTFVQQGNATPTWEMDGVIADGPGHTGSLVLTSPAGKEGNVRLALRNTNTFSGGLVVAAGADRGLELSAAGAAGAGDVTVNGSALIVAADRGLGSGSARTVEVNAGTLYFTAGQDYTAAAQPVVRVNDGGTLNIQSNDVDMVFDFDGGTLAHGNNSYTSDATLAVAAGGMTYVGGQNSGRTLTQTGTVTGGGKITFYGLSNLKLDGTNDGFSGGIEVLAPQSGAAGVNVTADRAMGTGTIEVADGGWLYVFAEQNYGGANPDQGLVVVRPGGTLNWANNNATLDLDVTLDGGALEIGGHNQGPNVDFSGQITLTDDSALVLDPKGDVSSLVSGTITQDGTDRRLIFNGGLEHQRARLNNPASDYAGGTEVAHGWLSVAARGALGTGAVDVTAEGWEGNAPRSGRLVTATGTAVLDGIPEVNVSADAILDIQTDDELADGGSPDVNIAAGGMLMKGAACGTTFTYSGAGKNVNVARGAIITPGNGLTEPTRADVLAMSGSGYGVYRGYADDAAVTGTVVFGDDGSNPYRGLGIGHGLAYQADPTLTFSGTAVEHGGGGVNFYAQAHTTVELQGAAAYRNDSGGAAGKLALAGRGTFNVTGVSASLPAVVEHDGNVGGRVNVNVTGGLPAASTLSVTDGVLAVGAPDAIAGHVNLNDGAIFYVDEALADGSVTVNAGAGVACKDADALGPGSGTLFDFAQAGSQVWLGVNELSHLPTNGRASFILVNKDVAKTWSAGLALGPTARLTMAGGDTGAPWCEINGGDITATGSVARIAARSDKGFYVNADVNMPATKLFIGDTSDFAAIDQTGLKALPVDQLGTVRFSGDNDIAEIEIVSGATLRLISSGAFGGAHIHVADGATLSCKSSTVASVIAGDGQMDISDNYGQYPKTLKLQPDAAHDAGISPGGSVGRLTGLWGTVEFDAPLVSGTTKYARMMVDVADMGGPAGVGYDQLRHHGAVKSINEADLTVYLGAPSVDLNPDAGGDMAIISADSVTGSAFHDVEVDTRIPGPTGAAVVDHWAVTTATAVSVSGGTVTLHGSALYWTARKGNATLDGVVDVLDLARLANNFGKDVANGDEVTWLQADFNLDGEVDVLDLAAIANNFGQSGKIDGAGGAGGAGGAPVPEPMTLGLIVLGGAAVLRRRRHA